MTVRHAEWRAIVWTVIEVASDAQTWKDTLYYAEFTVDSLVIGGGSNIAFSTYVSDFVLVGLLAGSLRCG